MKLFGLGSLVKPDVLRRTAAILRNTIVTLIAGFLLLAPPVGAADAHAGLRVGATLVGYTLQSKPVFQSQGVTKKGTVLLRLHLNSSWEVASIDPVAGDPELVSVAVASAAHWRVVKTSPIPPPVVMADVYFTAEDGSTRGPVPMPPPFPSGAVVGGIVVEGLSPTLKQRVLTALPFKAGDRISQEQFRRINVAVHKVNPNLHTALIIRKPSELTLVIGFHAYASKPEPHK